MQFEQRRAQILGHHSEIVEKIDQIQKKTTQILQEQETALLRSFQTELAELNAELAAEKKKVLCGCVCVCVCVCVCDWMCVALQTPK